MAYSNDEIKKKMQANSEAWHSADAATKKKLEAENQSLGKQLGASYNSSTGTWSDSSGSKLYNVNKSSNKKTTSAPSNYSGSATGVNTYTSDQDAIKAQMNANSQAWYGASKEEQDRLHAENEYLASLLGGNVASGYDSVTGTWTGSAGVPFADGYVSSSRPTYSDPYESDLDALLQSILTRPAFSYDYTKDPLFNQYKQQYMREGQRAMQDTLASAAAQAGGMNSYAITAGQQAQNYYGAQLGDKIPELWDLAYGTYLDDIENDITNMGLLNQMSDTQYNRFRDTMSDWENDRDFAYNAWRDSVDDSFINREYDYQLSRDQIEDARYNQKNSSSGNKTETSWDKYGISDLSSNAQTLIKNIEANKDQYLSHPDDIAYAIAKAATPKADGARPHISGDEAAILLRYFGYDPTLWMDFEETL